MTPAELFADLERKYNLPGGFLNRTWQIESGSGKSLMNPQSGAAGHFQFMPRTARQYGLENPNDLAQSAEAAARLAVDTRAALQRAGVEDPNAAQLYLAHQQGAGGALKLLRGAGQSAGSLVGEKAVSWNAGKPEMSGQEFAQSILSKFGGGRPQVAQAASSGDQSWSQAGNDAMRLLSGGLLGNQVPSRMGIDSSKYPASTEPGYSGEIGKQLQAAATDYGFKDYAPSSGPTAAQYAGLGNVGMMLMAAGAPKQTWKPGPAPKAVRGQWRDDIFAGLLG